MPTRGKVYAELQEDEYGNTVDVRFLPHLVARKREPPRKAIALALFLFTLGSVLLSLGLLVFFGVLPVLPLLIVGSTAFIPGAFYSRVAYHAWRGTPGFSFDDIPDYHDD